MVYDIHEEYPCDRSKNWIPKIFRSAMPDLRTHMNNAPLRKWMACRSRPETARKIPEKRSCYLPNYPGRLVFGVNEKYRDEDKLKFVYSGSIDVDRAQSKR